MKIKRLGNQQVLELIGKRLTQVRLNSGLEQKEVAELAGVNVSTVQKLESAKVSVGLLKFISVLRALDILDEIDNFIPEPPVRLASLKTTKNEVRKRVSKSKPDESSSPFAWNETIKQLGDIKE